MKRWLVLLAIISVGAALRSYKLTDPDITTFHAWRQADTAAFTHGYLAEGLNPLYPSIDRFPCRYRGEPFGRVEAELPVVAWLAALPLAALNVDVPPAPYLRAVSIFFYMLTSLYLFLLVVRLTDRESTGWVATAVFSVLPISIFFTATIQPDGPSLFFGAAFLYHLLVWLEDEDDLQGVISAVFAALVLLLKISNGYLVFPALYLFVTRRGWLGAIKTPKFWAWGIAVLIPLVAWSVHAHGFPWTFGVFGDRATSKFADWPTLTDPANWRKLSQRLTFDILTWSGVVLAVVGLTRFQERDSVRLGAAWGAGVVLLAVAALKGNMRHVYYQLPLVVPAAIVIAVGIQVLWDGKVAGKLTLAGLAGLYVVTTSHALFGPKHADWGNGYYHKDTPASVTEAVDLVEDHLEEGQKFVSTTRNPALFFNSGHRGWFYDGRDLEGFLRCTSPDAPYILLNNDDRKRAAKAKSAHPSVFGGLVEIAWGDHMALWRVTPAASTGGF